MPRRSLDLWPKRSFSWQWRRNPNPCAPPTLNPPSDCWLAEGPLGAPQAVAFQTSTVASTAVVEYTPPKKPCHPPFFTHRHTHTHTWVPLPPRVFPHHWLQLVWGKLYIWCCKCTLSATCSFFSHLSSFCMWFVRFQYY